MRFTEREMTVAVEAVAARAFDATPKLLRRRMGATSWDHLPRGARYRHLVLAGDVVLPGLTALPERPTVGATPVFTDAEYREAAEQALATRSDRGSGGGSGGGRRRLLAAVSMLRAAVAAMPPRQDPDALVVPDHL